jgi:hypothetical protein
MLDSWCEHSIPREQIKNIMSRISITGRRGVGWPGALLPQKAAPERLI